MNDPRFRAVEEALSPYSGLKTDGRALADGTIGAAVAVLLRGGAGDLDLLLIKRAKNPRDPWSGHMALPGGRQEPSDRGLMETAVRETREEIAVSLTEPGGGTLLGRLATVEPRSERLPRLTIVPFVFGVPESTRAFPAPGEVDRVHWVDVEHLRDPATAGTVDIDLPGGVRTFPCLRVDGEIVWGLTYRILTDLLGHLPSL